MINKTPHYTTDDIQFSHPTITNLTTRMATLGEGPTVLLLHGWPECWYSWRAQMVALANAGYRAIAPDMPGFGETQALPRCEDYNIARISEFILALINTVGGGPIILIGHDWGAINAWNFTLRHPQAVSQLINMSVPLRTHPTLPPTEVFRQRFGDRFFYQLYFQTPMLAETEFDANPADILRRLYCSPDTPRAKSSAGQLASEPAGWIARLGEPQEFPGWFSPADLAYYVAAYQHSGFAGGIHYYRNIDTNWRLMADYAHSQIQCPVLFIAGSEDIALVGADQQQLFDMMSPRVPQLVLRVLPGYGHWIQQEAVSEVNAELLKFLNRL